jgi:hypothetical protein
LRRDAERRSTRFSSKGTWSFNMMGRPAGQPTVRGMRAHGIRNDHRPAIFESHLGGSVCPYKADREGASDHYLCCLSPLPSNAVSPFCPRALCLPLAPSFISMAEKIIVFPPRDPWPVSSITDGDLEALVYAGLLWPRTTGQ